jgi:hypothetical protein
MTNSLLILLLTVIITNCVEASFKPMPVFKGVNTKTSKVITIDQTTPLNKSNY